jgi:multiple sugar transport system substrate-binding protein
MAKSKRFRLLASAVLLSLVLIFVLTACGDSPTASQSSTATTTAANAPTAPAGATTSPGATTAANAAAPTATPATVATGGNPNAKTKLNMWIMPNTPRAVQDLQGVLADFYTANPDVSITITQIGWDVALDKINTALQSGVGPDIIQDGTTWVGGFQSTGGLRPFSEAEIKAMGGVENFNAAAWSTTHLAGSKEIAAIPWYIETRALFYRTDLLKKAGLDATTAFKDWESFTVSLRKMKDAGQGLVKAPFAYPGKGDWNVVHNFAPWIWSAGGDMLSADNNKSAFNSDAAVKGAQFYTSLYQQGLVYKEGLEKNSGDIETFWANGDVGSIISGPWVVRNSKMGRDNGGYNDSITAKNFAVAMIPAGPAGAKPFVGGANLSILKSSKNGDAAVKVIQYLVSKKPSLQYADLTGNIPATLDAQNDPRYTDDANYKVFLQALRDGKSYPQVAAWNSIESAMQKNLSVLWDDIAAGKTDTIKARLNAAAQEVDTIIAASK